MPSSVHHNHLVIGLGGTGGNIIRSLRKLVFQNLRKDDPDGVNLRYLYVDTSAELMAPGDPSWKILGHSVQLPERNQMHIAGLNLRKVLDDLGNYPGINSWLGSREDFAAILNNADAAHQGAGQKRRLGRFLFACEAAQFRDRVKDMVREMTRDSSDGQRSNLVTFHLCCGLAGGTGSGSVIDAICQIRASFPDPKNRIILYLLLPEKLPAVNKAKKNYHANGFAALLELNALAVGAWNPHDVTGVRKERLGLQDPFNCCYLFSDENEANINVDVQNELPHIVASFLYQKIVEIQHIHWGATNTLLRQEIYENQEPFPECSSKGVPKRSRQFFSFGIKQIAYPEAEILEFITYSFARQAVLQLLYNKWVDGHGYMEDAAGQPFEEYVREKSTLEKWCLTDERLTLSEGILKGEINNKKWRTIPDFWKTIIPGYLTMVLEQNSSDPIRMLPELTRICDEVYRDQYRGEGVAKFYETKRRGDLREQVKEIRGRIEKDLFEDWKNGAKSMYDSSRLVAALLDAIEDRISGMDDKVAKYGEDSDRYRENEAAITLNRQEWARMGKLSMVFLGKHKKLLSAQAECYTTRYTMRTRVEGLRYAKDLLINLRQELNSLAAEVSRASALVDKTSKLFQSAVNSRCTDDARGNVAPPIIRFYDPGLVRSFTKELVTDSTEQRRQTGKIRARLVEQLGDKQTFAAFNTRITEGAFIDALESTCEESALESHRQFMARYPDRAGVLEVSLLDLLRREYEGNDERLAAYIHSVMSMSKNYLKWDSEQKILGGGSTSANDAANGLCISNLTVIVPEQADSAKFRNKLCSIIENATTIETQAVSNVRRPQEITLINITNLFPARFAEPVKFLRTAYLQRIGCSDGKRALIELHSEGYGGKLSAGQEFPDLYPESYKPADLRPWVMIAEAMDMIQVDTDPVTGVSKVYMVSKDGDGLSTMEELGASIESVIEASDVTVFEALRAAVEPRLETEYLHLSKRQDLVNAMRTKVEEIGKFRKANDPIFKASREGFIKAKEILSLEEHSVSA